MGRIGPVDHRAFVARHPPDTGPPEPEIADDHFDDVTDNHRIVEAGSDDSVYCCTLSAAADMGGDYSTNLGLEPGELVPPRTLPDDEPGFLELGRAAY